MNITKLTLDKIIVFDVEATSLQGTGFSVGAVRIINGRIAETKKFVSTESLGSCCKWVRENALKPSFPNAHIFTSNEQMREHFYNFLQIYNNYTIFSDCNYPVETNFLTDIAKDNLFTREFKLPCPLLDVCNFVDINISRKEMFEKDNADFIVQSPATRKLTEHDPLHDAIASAHVLLEAFSKKLQFSENNLFNR